MKRAFTTIGLSLVGCLLAGAVRAQVGTPADELKYFRVPHKYHIHVELAGALPVNPGLFNDYWNSAFQFGAGGGVTISWDPPAVAFDGVNVYRDGTKIRSMVPTFQRTLSDEDPPARKVASGS